MDFSLGAPSVPTLLEVNLRCPHVGAAWGARLGYLWKGLGETEHSHRGLEQECLTVPMADEGTKPHSRVTEACEKVMVHA